MKTKTPIQQTVKLSEISIKSNTRDAIENDSLNELSDSIRHNGLLQPIGLHFINDKYEIIYGHRRFVGSVKVQLVIVERNSINALVYTGLTEQEILELQIIENLHRKDVHPIEEATAYKRLIDFKKQSIAEIAMSVAKSASYVAQRLKLNDLLPEFKTAFLKDRLNLSTALKICKISLEDQEAFWSESFADDDETNFIEVDDHDLRSYLNNLNNAPFDINNSLIIPKMGACSTCPFNSAVNTFLFPDEAKISTCTKSNCFRDKTAISFDLKLKEALENPEIELVSFSHQELDDESKILIDKGYKVYSSNSFNVIEAPDKINYSDFEEELENENYEDKEEMETSYNEAVQEYEKELKEYQEKTISGKYIKAFIASGRGKGEHIFIEFKGEKEGKQTAKGLQEKLKSSSVTEEDIKTEINRINKNEVRKKELEEEKVQPLIYDAFVKNTEFKSNATPLNIQEKVGLIIMLVEYGGYVLEKEIYKLGNIKTGNSHKVYLFKALSEMSEPDLDELYNLFARSLMITKMKPIQTSRPSNCALASSLNQIINSYNKNVLSAAWASQLLERTKREARVKERILQLKSILKRKSK